MARLQAAGPSLYYMLMRRLPAVALAACALGLVLGCGGGGGDDGTAGVIHRLFLAALAQDPGRLESFPGALPDAMPAEPPLYPDATLVLSVREPAPLQSPDLGPQEQPGTTPAPLLYLIVLDTGAARSDVLAFYESELDEAPWRLEQAASTAELDTLAFSHRDDGDLTGTVAIARGRDDDRTSVLISFEDAGAVQVAERPFELGESVPLPAAFPPEVPIYQGATVRETAFSRAPRADSFLALLLTDDEQADVIDFYREHFEGLGWTVDESEAFGLADAIDFRDAAGDVRGTITADRLSEERRYTEVRIEVTANASRAPAATPAG